MHMSFEKIRELASEPEHPAFRAARMIKELHEENIAKIDGGFVFVREGVDVSAEIRAESAKQITLCEQIMSRAETMDPKHWQPAAMILSDLQEAIADARKVPSELDASIPEIGNYEHGK